MKRVSLFMVLIFPCVLDAGSYTKNDPPNKSVEPICKWTGTITVDEIIIYTTEPYHGKTEIHGQASFEDALPTMYREDETTDLNFTDDKGPGSDSVYSEITDILGKKCVGKCKSNGQAELHSVVIREWDNTYDIEVIFPKCVGTSTCQDGFEKDDIEATVSNHSLGEDKNVLSGTLTGNYDLPAGFGTATKTITWNLTRIKEDVELIVKPEGNEKGYEDWKPEPGMDELVKGNMMTVSLQLKGKNGKPLLARVESFELYLTGTSKEPGLTLNYPLSPRANQLPDLRFLMLPEIESADEDQFIIVGSADGKTGKAWIASYDGGGYGTLTVEAILTDKKHKKVTGHLFVSNGETEISIPKRAPGSHIAMSWWKDHGNPADVDDKEKNDGNEHHGDGLTAYEEYRGILLQGKYKRLDPDKKELGILASKSDAQLFDEGFSWFSQASDIELLLFDKNEIPENRRINQNTQTAKDFKQYALRIAKGNTKIPGMNGKIYDALGLTLPSNGIPARVTHIIIDADQIHADYIKDIKETPILPYTEGDMLANTVAHEMGHGVNVDHHGDDIPNLKNIIVLGLKDTIIHKYPDLKNPILKRPYIVGTLVGVPGNQQCGDENCLMCYVNRTNWVMLKTINGIVFNSAPILNYGNTFCKDKTGTGLNATGNYYGSATGDNGNCYSHIQLRD